MRMERRFQSTVYAVCLVFMHSCVTFSYPAGTIGFSVTYISLTFSCWSCIEVTLLLPPRVTSGDRLLNRIYRNCLLQKAWGGWGSLREYRNYPCNLQRWPLIICEQFQSGGPFKTISMFIYTLHDFPLDYTFQWFCRAVRSRDFFIGSSIRLHCSPVKHPSLPLGVGRNSVGQTGTQSGKTERGCKKHHDQSRQVASISLQAGQWANSEASEKRSGQSAYSKKTAKQQ